MSNRTLGLVAILGVIVVILFVFALSPKPVIAPTGVQLPSAVPTPIAQSLLSFDPNPLVMASSSASVDVIVSSNINDISGIQLELQYDPKMIRVLNIRPGSFFSNSIELIKTIDPVAGRVSYALVLQPSEVAKPGTGAVATITVAAVGTSIGSAMITVLPKSLVSAQGVSASVLKSATDLTIQFPGKTSTSR